LNKQKDICCLKEIFREVDLKAKLIDGFCNKLSNNSSALLKFLGNEHYLWESIRDKNFKEFLKIISDCADKKIFGYKFFEKHFRAFLRKEDYLEFLKESNTKIIVLARDNVLLQYISLLTARSTLVYSSQPNNASRLEGSNPEYEAVYQLNPVHVNYIDYAKYRKKIKRQFQQKLLDIAEYNLSAIYLKYEQFTGAQYHECFANIFSFLNLDFKDFIDLRETDGSIGGHRKINVYKTEDKISNFAEFRQIAEENNDTEALQFLTTQ
jgi:hypothetical protein